MYGHPLYLYAPDGTGPISKAGSNLGLWPAVVWSGTPTVAGGLDASKVAVFVQRDGTRQLSYNGHLLYTFLYDFTPGTATGDGETSFYLLDAAGNAELSRGASSSGRPNAGGQRRSPRTRIDAWSAVAAPVLGALHQHECEQADHQRERADQEREVAAGCRPCWGTPGWAFPVALSSRRSLVAARGAVDLPVMSAVNEAAAAGVRRVTEHIGVHRPEPDQRTRARRTRP